MLAVNLQNEVTNDSPFWRTLPFFKWHLNAPEAPIYFWGRSKLSSHFRLYLPTWFSFGFCLHAQTNLKLLSDTRRAWSDSWDKRLFLLNLNQFVYILQMLKAKTSLTDVVQLEVLNLLHLIRQEKDFQIITTRIPSFLCALKFLPLIAQKNVKLVCPEQLTKAIHFNPLSSYAGQSSQSSTRVHLMLSGWTLWFSTCSTKDRNLIFSLRIMFWLFFAWISEVTLLINIRTQKTNWKKQFF